MKGQGCVRRDPTRRGFCLGVGWLMLGWGCVWGLGSTGRVGQWAPRLFLLVCVLAGGARPALAVPKTMTVGSLTLTHCIPQYDGYCGSITQPLDRTGGLAGTITVGFEFYPHTDSSVPSAGTIIAQEGGPGFSTTGSRDGYVRMLSPLRNFRDILLVDKRGTGRSSPIDCPALQKAYNPNLSDVAACGNQLGASAWFYRSADAADDLAAVLAALQTGPVSYYGDSYATWFGQVFAVRHPDLLINMVLDSAYPVIGDHDAAELNGGQLAMDIACERSAPCAALGGSATARFDSLLNAVRAQPFSGTAPGANGEPRTVTVDAEGLVLIIANAGNSLATWRDLDAAGRAWMENSDPAPLLRMLAEARDSYSGGGNYKGFSVGLADAVSCGEYGAIFNQSAPVAKRISQYKARIARLEANLPNAYPPFTFEEALKGQMGAESENTCLPWPSPPSYVPAGQPVPPNAAFPNIPVLVLSGELDTVTAPSEGRDTAALFPNAVYIKTPNMVHESAVGDEGFFVPPNGQDFGQCIGPIVRYFLLNGNTGDRSCLKTIRPIRTVPAFATSYTTVFPATAASGNATDATGLVLASAVAETVGDAMAEYLVNTSGSGAGLRGGTFTFAPSTGGYTITMTNCNWTNDLTVSGTVAWNQISGAVDANVTFTAAGHSGTETIIWNDQQTEATATLGGTIDGAALAATRLAP